MSKRILVVDDEAHIVQVLLLKLGNAGYTVLTASDGEEGLEVAVSQRPDLIVTDFQMPYMTGLELCRALADDASTAGIPVMMLTARGYALEPEDLAIAGVDGPRMIRTVVSKPFSPRGIVEQIQSILGEAACAKRSERVSKGADEVAASGALPPGDVRSWNNSTTGGMA